MIWWLIAAACVAFLVWKRLPHWRAISLELDAEEAALSARKRPLVIQHEGAPFSRSGLGAPPSVPPLSDDTYVQEQVSVVLRRQIPVRFDEPPRSWLGGMPMMPETVEWPTTQLSDHPERGPVPMNFAAQICCADLPEELWGGLGPRRGWLLLFLSGASWEGDKEDSAKVIHIDELGHEREPPPGIFPVHDLGYTGPDYGFVRNQEEVPSVWRRWPVDIVNIPNELVETDGRGPSVIPDGFASTLYDNAPVSNESGRMTAPEGPPFSWRGALYVVDSIARSLRDKRSESLRDDSVTLSAPNWASETLEKLAVERVKWVEANERFASVDAGADPAAAEKLAQNQKKRDERIANIDLAMNFLREDEPTWQRLEHSHQNYLAWRAQAVGIVEDLRVQIQSHDLDHPLSEGDWGEIHARLAGHTVDRWVYGYRDLSSGAPMKQQINLVDLAASGLDAARTQIAAEYYAASPEKRALVPADVIEALEPRWRQLYGGLPHRMGGAHDGIQSDPITGSTNELLLFQIVTDDSMHWCWGDAGAYYVFIRTGALERGDFAAARGQLECH